ncbi:MAG: transglutaminase-like domain-containing protein [Fibrobacterota bacterium]|nr:transglutaminase domain-containing protein [Chitinispirillaceae bacterium]
MRSVFKSVYICILPFIALVASCVSTVSFSVLKQLDNSSQAQFPKEWNQEPVISLFDSTLLTFESNDYSNWVIYKNISYYYINKRIPEELETISLTLSYETQENHAIDASVKYPDGSVVSIPQKDISLRKRYVLGQYETDDDIADIKIPAYQKGIVIRVAFEYNLTRPEFLSSEYFRGQYPVMNRAIIVTTPKSLTGTLSNGEHLHIDSSTSFDSDNVTKSYSSTTVKKIPDYATVANPEQWYAGIHFSLPQKGPTPYSWVALGNHHLLDLDPILDSMRFVNDFNPVTVDTNRDSIIKWAFGTVRKNIRYHADFSDNHSFIPRPVDLVIKNGYGDCKEMASLLTMMLRSKGLNAGVALITSPGSEQGLDSLPSLGWFNHAITYVENPDGTMFLLDPTFSFGPFESSAHYLLGQKVFILKKDSSFLTSVKPDSNYVNRIETDAIIQETGDTWSMNGTIRLIGRTAMSIYPYVNSATSDQKAQIVSTLFSELFHLTPSSSSLDSLTDTLITLSYVTDFTENFVQFEQNGIRLNRPSLAGGDTRHSTFSYEGPRVFTGVEQVDKWTILHPFKTFESESINNAWFSGMYSRNGNEIIRSLLFKKVQFTIEDSVSVKEYLSSRQRFQDAYLWE